MTDESAKISAKTWSRTVEPINKLGYMDGAADGQTASFQSSFNSGYEQGFGFGLELGLNHAIDTRTTQSNNANFIDPRQINCQMCTTETIAQENVVNLFNLQKEKNDNYIKNHKNNKLS